MNGCLDFNWLDVTAIDWTVSLSDLPSFSRYIGQRCLLHCAVLIVSISHIDWAPYGASYWNLYRQRKGQSLTLIHQLSGSEEGGIWTMNCELPLQRTLTYNTHTHPQHTHTQHNRSLMPIQIPQMYESMSAKFKCICLNSYVDIHTFKDWGQ